MLFKLILMICLLQIMESVDQTLRKARQIDERFKKFMQKKDEHDKSMNETLKRIDKAQESLKQTKTTIGAIDKLYERLENVLSETINAAVASVQKNTLLSVADVGWQPIRVNAQKVISMLKQKKKILILTGAGVSAASGIPTFRGDGGFWSKEKLQIDPDDLPEKIDPQILLTKQFYDNHPERTWKWLKNFYQIKAKAKPNKGHFALSQVAQHLVGRGKQVCIVTQNIDNFHSQAKKERLSKNKNFKDYEIYQIHGNILKIRCDHCTIEDKKLCFEPYQSYIDIIQMKSKIFCPRCQGPLRPHVMFFDEFYDENFNRSQTVNKFLEETDAILVIGTALQTGLANGIVYKAIQTGKQIVEINTACEIKKNGVWWMENKAELVLEAFKNQVIKK